MRRDRCRQTAAQQIHGMSEGIGPLSDKRTPSGTPAHETFGKWLRHRWKRKGSGETQRSMAIRGEHNGGRASSIRFIATDKNVPGTRVHDDAVQIWVRSRVVRGHRKRSHLGLCRRVPHLACVRVKKGAVGHDLRARSIVAAKVPGWRWRVVQAQAVQGDYVEQWILGSGKGKGVDCAGRTRKGKARNHER